MSGPLTDVVKLAAKGDAERRLRAWELRDLETVLSSPEGRRVYYRFVYELCDLEGGSFYGDDKRFNANEIGAYQEGVRRVGRVLKREAFESFPDLWLLMVTERIERVKADKARRELEQSAQESEDHE